MMTCLGKWLPTLLLLYKCCFSLCDECVCTYLHVWICPRTAPAAQETTANVSYDERTDLHPTLAQQCPKALDSWCKAHRKFLVGALSKVILYWKIRLWDTKYPKWLCLMICAGKGALDREYTLWERGGVLPERRDWKSRFFLSEGRKTDSSSDEKSREGPRGGHLGRAEL